MGKRCFNTKIDQRFIAGVADSVRTATANQCQRPWLNGENPAAQCNFSLTAHDQIELLISLVGMLSDRAADGKRCFMDIVKIGMIFRIARPDDRHFFLITKQGDIPDRSVPAFAVCNRIGRCIFNISEYKFIQNDFPPTDISLPDAEFLPVWYWRHRRCLPCDDCSSSECGRQGRAAPAFPKKRK